MRKLTNTEGHDDHFLNSSSVYRVQPSLSNIETPNFLKQTSASHTATFTMNQLPAIVTPVLLSSIRKHPNLPAHTWYLVAATTLSAINRPDEIPSVFRHALDKGPADMDLAPGRDERLMITRRMREALIKASAVGGVPKVDRITILHSSSRVLQNSWLTRRPDDQCPLRAQKGDTRRPPGRAIRSVTDGASCGHL